MRDGLVLVDSEARWRGKRRRRERTRGDGRRLVFDCDAVRWTTKRPTSALVTRERLNFAKSDLGLWGDGGMGFTGGNEIDGWTGECDGFNPKVLTV